MNTKQESSSAGLIVLGSQWGDEGKAKVIDLLACHFDIIARYQGGGNAGHTVIVDGEKIIFHIIPTGILHEDKMVLLGNGMVIYPPTLIEEMNKLARRGLQFSGRLHISRRAHVIMPYHLLFEKYYEQLREGDKIGTTMRGIGPTYEDKIARRGIMMSDLLDLDILKTKLETILTYKNAIITKVFGESPMSAEQIIEEYKPYIEVISPYICDGISWLNGHLDGGKMLLCEGAQGTHLDIDFGTYPFVTSSNSSAGGALTGTGIGPGRVQDVMGVVKAYVTRVGSGPFPSEETGEMGERIRLQGNEYGSTTGRPRRCGWFDVPVLRYAKNVNGLTALALTKLDVLSGVEKIKICHQYRYKGNIVSELPEDPSALGHCEPIYIEMEGWKEDISSVTQWEGLPPTARDYVHKLEELTGVEIALISVGAEREKYFVIDDAAVTHRFPQFREIRYNNNC